MSRQTRPDTPDGHLNPPIYLPPPHTYIHLAEATVLAVTVTAVPNTDLVLRKCKVAYHPPGAAPDAAPVVEEEVGPDRLRLVEPKGACGCGGRCGDGCDGDIGCVLAVV